jgi:putative (di)nucleoside polyphosphate hydrolase
MSKRLGFPGEYFRASVGAVVMDGEGRVLACRRADVGGDAWQLPQGGLERGEEPLDAVLREVEEELGIRRRDLDLVSEMEPWLSYELPEASRSEKTGRGQTQRWFFFRFTGSAEEINPDGREFDACTWMPLEQLAHEVVAFRRPVYAALLARYEQGFDGA